MRSNCTPTLAAAIVVLIATACSSPSSATGSASATASSTSPATSGVAPSPATSSSPSVAAEGGQGTGGVQVNGACSGTDVAAALKAAAKAQADAGSYRVAGAVTAGGNEQEVTLEFAKPDRVHVILGPIEYIAVGSTTWQNTAGQWRPAPGVDLSTLTAGMGQLNDELLTSATFTEVSVDTNANVDGQPAVLYRYHESIPSELEADSQFWLDPASCRPIRNIASGTASGATSKIDVTYSDWGRVTIEAPA